MKKKIKKAFTLVELLVVIAILAILATVSIVGYNSFTKKAKVSNDTVLVSQLNTLLKADSMVNGDAKTPTDALKITSEAGYDVEKLTPTTNDYEIIWNQAINQFALLDEKGNVVYGEKNEGADEYKNWKFVSEYNSATDYSVYLKGTEITSIPNVIHAGIDVGNNTAITTVNYTNSDSKDDVRIRTNGGILNVDAATDTVKHFGSLDKAVITAVAPHSYYENGIVKGNIEVSTGHVVVNADASVESVIATTANVTVDVNNNKTEVKAKDGVDLTGKVNGATTKTVKYVSTAVELQNAEGEVVLNADISSSVTFNTGKTIVLDANGHSINGKITLLDNSNLTIKGNGTFTKNGYLFWLGDSNAAGGTLIIESGNFIASEACVANMTGKDFTKSNVIINGGTFTSNDNGVFMSNGSAGTYQGANWTINGGIFNCNIKTKGYIACGIYLPNTDVAFINGGTFNVKNGAGIVCRSGKATINKGVVINIENDGTVVEGKVGDSTVLLNVSSFIVKDTKSNYPAGEPEIINNSQYTIVEYKDKTLI